MKPILTLVFILGLIGCGAKTPPMPTTLQEVEPVNAATNVDVTLSKKKLDTALAKGDAINEVRAVQIFRRGENTASAIPQYRLFEIKQGSVYSMMGLENTDVLQAVNGLIIYKPEGFSIFARQVLRTMDRASVNVIRNGNPILLNITLTE